MTATKKPLCISAIAALVFLGVFLLFIQTSSYFLSVVLGPLTCAVALIEILLQVCAVRDLILCDPKWPSVVTLIITTMAAWYIGYFAFFWMFFALLI